MNDQWYYNRAGQQHGPLTRAQLQQLGMQGQLGRGDMVWTQSLGDWKPAEQVPGLLPPGAPPSPYASPHGSSYAAARRRAGGGGFGYLMLLIGGGLMLGAFAMPWWYLSVEQQDSDSTEDRAPNEDDVRESRWAMNWMTSHYTVKQLEKMQEDARDEQDEDEHTERIWGWRVWPARAGLFASILAILTGIMGLASAGARRSIFVLVFSAAMLAFVTALSSLMWLIGAPSVKLTERSEEISLGCHVGVYAMLAAAALVAVFGFILAIPRWRAAAAKMRE